MAGGTHVFDMIKRLRNNEDLRRNNYFKVKRLYRRTLEENAIDYRSASAEELAKLRRDVREARIREGRNQAIALAFSVGIVLILLFALFIWIT